jgi:hypothetical protein
LLITIIGHHTREIVKHCSSLLSILLQAGQEYGLKELLQAWGLPDEYHTQLRKEWKGVLAKECQTEEEATLAFMKPQPVLVAQSCGQAVLDEIGSNVFEYLVRSEWNEFPRPRFAINFLLSAPKRVCALF